MGNSNVKQPGIMNIAHECGAGAKQGRFKVRVGCMPAAVRGVTELCSGAEGAVPPVGVDIPWYGLPKSRAEMESKVGWCR